MRKYIDMHVHLTHEMYKEDLDKIIENSIKEGVEKFVLIGCDEVEIKKSLELYKKYPDYIYLAIGFHPIDVRDVNDEKLKWMEELLKDNEKIIAVGEIGLDYYWHPEESELQKEYFKKQIKIAKKYNKNIIIHARDSIEDCYEILREENYFKGIMHSFAGDYEQARKFISKGMYISISGPVTFKNGHNQKDVVRNISLDKLFVETDGPFLTPAPYRGKRNEPKYLKYIVEEIAKIRELDEVEVANVIYSNSKKFIEESLCKN